MQVRRLMAILAEMPQDAWIISDTPNALGDDNVIDAQMEDDECVLFIGWEADPECGGRGHLTPDECEERSKSEGSQGSDTPHWTNRKPSNEPLIPLTIASALTALKKAEAATLEFAASELDESGGCDCWYCYWGWPRPVRDIYKKWLAEAGERAMHFGPAHVVWEDENFDLIQSCLDDFDDWVEKWNDSRFTPEQLAAVRGSLLDMMALPEGVRDPEPEDYDGENPENYPPADGLEMEHLK